MLILDFPANWYFLFAFGLVVWLAFSFVRKSIAGNLLFGLTGLVFAVAVELIGVGAGLWNYAGGNWPAILWPSYFVFSMAIYQAFRVVEEKLKK